MAIAALVLFGSIIEAVYYLRVVGRLYFKPPQESIRVMYVHYSAIIAMGILAVITLIAGLYPDLVMQYLKPAAAELLDKSIYIKSVLSAGL